ncbi:hypothetical protein [Methanoregula sp.]|uniref:hypothetical protein n=1 Tax=Methanoregula sp. TaxID=2052170 RepID=UPI00356A0FBA
MISPVDYPCNFLDHNTGGCLLRERKERSGCKHRITKEGEPDMCRMVPDAGEQNKGA